MMPRRPVVATLALALLVAAAGCTDDEPQPSPSASPAVTHTPSSSATSAPLPSDDPGPVVRLVKLAAVSDPNPPGGYGLTGRPDGLGLTTTDGVPTLVVAHELAIDDGVARAHGSPGAFVSAWALDPTTPRIVDGRDLITKVRHWDYVRDEASSRSVLPGGARLSDDRAMQKFCSAFLSEPGQLWDAATGTGYDGQLFFVNEEVSDVGRSFAVALDGVAYELPRLGLLKRENTVVAAATGRVTVAAITEDASGGTLRVYAGAKQADGNPIERAGFMNGDLMVISAAGASTDKAFRKKYGKGAPAPFELSKALNTAASGASQAAAARSAGTTFNRIEDAAFDPSDPNALYFTTTAGGRRNADPALPKAARDGGGLWRVDFTDVSQPEFGGTLTLLLDGSEAPYLDGADNIAIDAHGNVLIQEDPTSGGHYHRILAYRISDGALAVVTHVPVRSGDAVDQFGGSSTRTKYESSGVIDASSVYGDGWFIFTVQVAKSDGLADALGQREAKRRVQRGFLYAMQVSDWDAIYAASLGSVEQS